MCHAMSSGGWLSIHVFCSHPLICIIIVTIQFDRGFTSFLNYPKSKMSLDIHNYIFSCKSHITFTRIHTIFHLNLVKCVNLGWQLCDSCVKTFPKTHYIYHYGYMLNDKYNVPVSIRNKCFAIPYSSSVKVAEIYKVCHTFKCARHVYLKC